jgi:hypothetical protein
MAVGLAGLSVAYTSLTANLEGPPAAGPEGEAPGRVGEADRAELSPRAQARLIEVRALVVALRSATARAGKALGRRAGGAGGAELARFLADLLGRHGEDFAPDETGLAPIEHLAAEFTPEKTAERIFRFAVSHYGQWLDGRQDSREARESFVEFMGAAVEKGFGGAQAILGVLPEAVQDGVDRTHELVSGMFEDFIENGCDMDASEAASVLAGGRAFNAAFGPAAEGREALFEEILDRLGPDGVLRMDAPAGEPAPLVDIVG